jgi:hypothetical protein
VNNENNIWTFAKSKLGIKEKDRKKIAMTRITSALTAKSGEREANAAEWGRLTDELNLRRRAAAEGGSSKACKRHAARGKLLARESAAGLIDPGSPFLEIGAFAAFARVEPTRVGVFDNAGISEDYRPRWAISWAAREPPGIVILLLAERPRHPTGTNPICRVRVLLTSASSRPRITRFTLAERLYPAFD